jgi:aryl-alcohol dehydrogenase-like predicted oxidoreductase
MPKYEISYTYSGFGTATVEAKSKKEAEEKFFDGEVNYEDNGDNYEIGTVEKIVD